MMTNNDEIQNKFEIQMSEQKSAGEHSTSGKNVSASPSPLLRTLFSTSKPRSKSERRSDAIPRTETPQTRRKGNRSFHRSRARKKPHAGWHVKPGSRSSTLVGRLIGRGLNDDEGFGSDVADFRPESENKSQLSRKASETEGNVVPPAKFNGDFNKQEPTEPDGPPQEQPLDFTKRTLDDKLKTSHTNEPLDLRTVKRYSNPSPPPLRPKKNSVWPSEKSPQVSPTTGSPPANPWLQRVQQIQRRINSREHEAYENRRRNLRKSRKALNKRKVAFEAAPLPSPDQARPRDPACNQVVNHTYGFPDQSISIPPLSKPLKLKTLKLDNPLKELAPGNSPRRMSTKSILKRASLEPAKPNSGPESKKFPGKVAQQPEVMKSPTELFLLTLIQRIESEILLIDGLPILQFAGPPGYREVVINDQLDVRDRLLGRQCPTWEIKGHLSILKSELTRYREYNLAAETLLVQYVEHRLSQGLCGTVTFNVKTLYGKGIHSRTYRVSLKNEQSSWHQDFRAHEGTVRLMAEEGSLKILPNSMVEVTILELGFISRFSKVFAAFVSPMIEVVRSIEFQYVSMMETDGKSVVPEKKFVLKLSSLWRPPSMEEFYNR